MRPQSILWTFAACTTVKVRVCHNCKVSLELRTCEFQRCSLSAGVGRPVCIRTFAVRFHDIQGTNPHFGDQQTL